VKSGASAALGLALATTILAQQYTDVPFVATSTNVVDAMLDLAAIKPGDVLIDLGSGDGRIVIAAAKRFGIQATGVEIDPDLVHQSQAAALQEGVGAKTTFVQADLFQYDLRKATVVTMFLTPGFNQRLRSKLLAELAPGARVVSHRFDLGTWAPAKTVKVQDDPIYLWIVPPHGAPTATAPPRTSSAPPFEKLSALFSYDAAAPLSPHAEEAIAADGVSIAPVSFSGARGPVSATIVTPARKATHPAVIFVPDSGRRDEFLPEALSLARAATPVVSLLIDAPAERPIGWRRNFNILSDTDNDRDIHIQAVVDIRRAIDLLASRPDVDATRIAYVGHGYGANWGVILSAVERRLHAFVLIAGFPSLSELIDSDDAEWANLRYGLGAERVARYRESISAVDPIRFAPHSAGAPILFQFGRFDAFVSRAMAERLAQSVPGRQKSVFYDAGHSLNDPRALADRIAFVRQALSPANQRERK
jgi:dienelactone hydrolase/precorrin-6B methylase 2